jgi:hypothetical protein
MTWFLQISDLPPDAPHRLSIHGPRQEIQEASDRNRPQDDRTPEGKSEALPPGRARRAEAPDAELPAVVFVSFVTDWQQDHQRPDSRLAIDPVDFDNEQLFSEDRWSLPGPASRPLPIQ